MLIVWIGVVALVMLIPVDLWIRRRKQPFNYHALTAISSVPGAIVLLGFLIALERPPSTTAILILAAAWLLGVIVIYCIYRALSKSYEKHES